MRLIDAQQFETLPKLHIAYEMIKLAGNEAFCGDKDNRPLTTSYFVVKVSAFILCIGKGLCTQGDG